MEQCGSLYLSAAFAATVLGEVRAVAVVPESYTPLRGRQGLRRKPPALFASRGPIIEVAYQRLRSAEPLALIHGPLGSDRDGVADHIGYQLERAGYLLIAPKLDEHLSPHQSAIEAMANMIVGTLRFTYTVSGLPERLLSAHEGVIPGYRHAQIRAYCQQLAAALAADVRRFVVILTLRSGDPELASLAEELARALGSTALLLVASAPLANVPSQAQVAIPTISHADLRDYALHARRSLSDLQIDRLLNRSGGLPLLVRRLLAQPDESWDVPTDAPTPAVIAQEVQLIFDSLAPQLQLLAGIDALLESASYIHQDADMEAIAQRMGTHGRWDSASALNQALIAYKAETADGVRELLRVAVLDRFLGWPEYQMACAAAAGYYASYPSPQHYLAARYAALAGDWAQAEAHLHPFVEQPALAHSARRDRLFQLAKQVAESEHAADGAALWLLAGDCAAFLGDYDQALDAYYQVVPDVLPGDLRETRARAQILAVYQARGDHAAADAAAAALRRSVSPEHPFAVLVIAHEGVSLMQRGN
ncbi:hypothetical protein EKD04_025040, partial [Chloroflexales bacterium ZM16-3]|nr:hypothetical protein [Chloroflexales bacterium ZM16-3]